MERFIFDPVIWAVLVLCVFPLFFMYVDVNGSLRVLECLLFYFSFSGAVAHNLFSTHKFFPSLFRSRFFSSDETNLFFQCNANIFRKLFDPCLPEIISLCVSGQLVW